MGRHHHSLAFMPGPLVVFGGRVDPSDWKGLVAGPLPSRVDGRPLKRMRRASPGRARSFGVAAIRKLAEETGLLLAVSAWRRLGSAATGGNSPPPASNPLSTNCRLWRAITPKGYARRPDMRFFVADYLGRWRRIADGANDGPEFSELGGSPGRQSACCPFRRSRGRSLA